MLFVKTVNYSGEKKRGRLPKYWEATFLKPVNAYVIIVRDKWLWSAGTRPGQPACLLRCSACCCCMVITYELVEEEEVDGQDVNVQKWTKITTQREQARKWAMEIGKSRTTGGTSKHAVFLEIKRPLKHVLEAMT